MKIVSMGEFLKLPKGTVYYTYEPHILRGPEIKKNDTISEHDWYYNDLDSLDAPSAIEEMDILKKKPLRLENLSKWTLM